MIKTKEKPCKSIGIAKGFDSCGVLTLVRKYGMCLKCYSKWLLTTKEGQNKLFKATVKAKEPRLQLSDARSHKKARTSLNELKKQTQLLFNKYIRLRDQGLPCISSGIPYMSDFDAGHCFSVGSYEGLRFDYDNCHGQSIGDNRFKEGNSVDYLINLPKRIGQKRFDELMERAKEYKMNGYKFSRVELLEIQKDIKQKTKELK